MHIRWQWVAQGGTRNSETVTYCCVNWTFNFWVGLLLSLVDYCICTGLFSKDFHLVTWTCMVMCSISMKWVSYSVLTSLCYIYCPVHYICSTTDWLCSAANPPDFRGSLPVLRPVLWLYNSAMKTPDFSFFCIKIVVEVIRYVRLC